MKTELSGLARRSKIFQSFYESCFPMSFEMYREGLDEEALLALLGEERIEAERLMLDALVSEETSHAIRGLGLLRSNAAITPLKEQMCDAVHCRRVEIALALYRIEGNVEYIDAIISVLQDGESSKFCREKAAFDLRYCGLTYRVVNALLAALVGGEVAHTANRSLQDLFAHSDEIVYTLKHWQDPVFDRETKDFVLSKSEMQRNLDRLGEQIRECMEEWQCA